MERERFVPPGVRDEQKKKDAEVRSPEETVEGDTLGESSEIGRVRGPEVRQETEDEPFVISSQFHPYAEGIIQRAFADAASRFEAGTINEEQRDRLISEAQNAGIALYAGELGDESLRSIIEKTESPQEIDTKNRIEELTAQADASGVQEDRDAAEQAQKEYETAQLQRGLSIKQLAELTPEQRDEYKEAREREAKQRAFERMLEKTVALEDADVRRDALEAILWERVGVGDTANAQNVLSRIEDPNVRNALTMEAASYFSLQPGTEPERIDEFLRSGFVYPENKDAALEPYDPVRAGKTDPYELLGITSEATEEELRDAYRRMAKMYHPDSNQGVGNVEGFMKVQAAYHAILKERAEKPVPESAEAPTGKELESGIRSLTVAAEQMLQGPEYKKLRENYGNAGAWLEKNDQALAYWASSPFRAAKSLASKIHLNAKFSKGNAAIVLGLSFMWLVLLAVEKVVKFTLDVQDQDIIKNYPDQLKRVFETQKGKNSR